MKEQAHQRKDETCRFNGRSILHEAEKTSRTCHGRIENKDGNRASKSQSQNHGRRGAGICREMTNSEDLGNKLPEKLQLPQKNINYLRENSCRFLGASASEGNQQHSKPAAEKESHDKGQEGIANMICKLFQQQEAPEVEVDKFSGNPSGCQYFSTMFKEMVQRKIKDPVRRLTCLIKVTDGEAKDLRKHCIHLTPDIGYDTSLILLNETYVNPHSLLACYRKEIKLLALVKPVNAMGFRKFHNFALKCETFSKSTSWNSLEMPEILCVLVSKLTEGLRDRWNRTVQGIRGSYGREPCLSDFSGFVNEEIILVNDPIFSREAVQQYVTYPKKKLNKHKKIGNFATHSTNKVFLICPLCDGTHN